MGKILVIAFLAVCFVNALYCETNDDSNKQNENLNRNHILEKRQIGGYGGFRSGGYNGNGGFRRREYSGFRDYGGFRPNGNNDYRSGYIGSRHDGNGGILPQRYGWYPGLGARS